MQIKETILRSYLQGKGLDPVIFDELRALSMSPFDKLVEAVRSDKAREHFDLRDRFEVGGREYEIIGFDHDRSADDPDAPTVTLMARCLVKPHRLHPGSSPRGWIDTELRYWLNHDYLHSLPYELTCHMCRTLKTTHSYDGDAVETIDRIFIPSESELFGSAICAAFESGARYEAFGTSNDRIRTSDWRGAEMYWTRTIYGESPTTAVVVDRKGAIGYGGVARSDIYTPMCFVIA